MTELELMKYVSEREGYSCRVTGADCRNRCPSSVRELCSAGSGHAQQRKLEALNQYHMLLMQEKKVEPVREKVWRIKTLGEFGERRPMAWVEQMDHFMGMPLPEGADPKNFHVLPEEIWSFSQSDITFDYPVRD